MVGVEFVIDLIGKQLLRNRKIREGRIPENGIDVFDLPDPVAERRNVPVGHILNDYQRERAFSEVLHKLVLTDDRVHVGRQVVEHIVVDPCTDHSENRRHHKHDRQNKDRYAVLHDRF